MEYRINYDDYPKIWTANDSFRLNINKKRSRAAETIQWYPLDPMIKEEFEDIKIDLNYTGKQKPLHEIVDNIHYTGILGKKHITIEFIDRSSIGYYIDDNGEGVRRIPVKGPTSSFAHKIFNTNNYYIDKIKIIEILSKITNSKRFKEFIGHYYETSSSNEKKKKNLKEKSKELEENSNQKNKELEQNLKKNRVWGDLPIKDKIEIIYLNLLKINYFTLLRIYEY